MTPHASPDTLPSASRKLADGTTERVELRGSDGERIYAYTYEPASSPRGAVLICPALHAEFTRSYRREVLLARGLAASGFAVERFHYRGTGNSDGDDPGVTFSTMGEDADACLEHLRDWSGVDALVLVGSRSGALVAASTAARHDPADLVLWDPLLDASRFFRDAFRTKLVNDRKSGIAEPETGEQLAERLRSGDAVDLVGHTIYPDLYGSCIGRTLVGELGTRPRSMLILQISQSGSVRPDLARELERWRAGGFQVDVETIRGTETWWLVDERWTNDATQTTSNQLIDLTGTWIQARAPIGGPA